MDSTAPTDSFAKAMRPEKPRKLHMYGLGVTPTDEFGDVLSRKVALNMALDYQEKLLYLETRMAKFEARLGAQNNPQETQNAKRSESMNEPCHIKAKEKVKLKSISNPSRIVAKGVVRSTDTSTTIGLEELGEDWYEVFVDHPIKTDERLFRPWLHFKTIGDVHAVTVAWSNNFVYVCVLYFIIC